MGKKQARKSKEIKENKEMKEIKDAKENKEVNEAKEVKEVNESKDYYGRRPNISIFGKENKGIPSSSPF